MGDRLHFSAPRHPHDLRGLINENVESFALQKAKPGGYRRRTIEQEGVQYEFVEEPNTKHAFFNDTGSSYNPQAAADAWPRTLDFFRQNLPA